MRMTAELVCRFRSGACYGIPSLQQKCVGFCRGGVGSLVVIPRTRVMHVDAYCLEKTGMVARLCTRLV